MKLLILGAAGQIGRMLAERLLAETDLSLVLFGRNVSQRMQRLDSSRVERIDGDFNDFERLKTAMRGVTIIYLNDMNSPAATRTIVKAAQESKAKKLIGTTILGIYDEVPGAFGRWNAKMVGKEGTNRHKKSAKLIEESGIDYTLLRLTWLYNETGNEDYEYSHKGEPFVGAQVTRQAVTRFIMTIIEQPALFKNESLGVVEPNTDFPKPSFY